MRRVATCVMLAVFLASASKAGARDGDNGTPPPKAGNTPAAKENENGVVQSEVHELRDLVQAQSDELRGLRKRLAAVEAERAAPKVVPAPAAASSLGTVQPATVAAASPVEAAAPVSSARVSDRPTPATIA